MKSHSKQDQLTEHESRKHSDYLFESNKGIKEEKLLDKLIKQEAELQKLQKERKKLQKEKDLLERNYKTITKSRLWRYSLPFRRSVSLVKRTWNSLQSRLLGSKYKAVKKENQKLQADKRKLERELFVSQQKLKTAQKELKSQAEREKDLLLKVEGLHRDKLIEIVKTASENGEMIKCLDKLLENRAIHDEKYRMALRQAAKLYSNKDEDSKYAVYHKVLKGLKIEEVPEFIIRSAESVDTISLDHISSFKASLSMRARQRQLVDFMPERILDHKVDAYSFVDSLGVRRPWVSNERFPFSEIPQKGGVVIKPLEGAGSRGVYLIHEPNRIQDVKRSQILHSWNELEAYVKADLASGWVEKDEWIIEELVLESEGERLPARDLKFYCFYGKVALILEILRFPEVKYCWWTADGQQVVTGKYEDESFEGLGATKEQIKLVEKLSAEIPAPFMRIDFLKNGENIVFGEFTPKPGHYDHFNDSTDRLLGEYYLEAEGRLMKDVLWGKSFAHFHQFLFPIQDEERKS
jgi:hypothetical protein